MAYYLTIKEKTQYKLLDVTDMIEFKRLSKYKINSYSLEELDLFTSKFSDEIELKTKLYENNVITLNEITKEITIRRKNKEELKKVMYDLVYNYNKKYTDEIYVRGMLLSLQGDKTFLNKLLNHYRNSYKQENLAKIRTLLDYENGNTLKMYEALNAFFIDEIYDINYSTGHAKIKYKSLHDLGMFIYEYVSKKDKLPDEIEQNETKRRNLLEELEQSLALQKKPESKVYTRKRKYKLDGQISFF